MFQKKSTNLSIAGLAIYSDGNLPMHNCKAYKRANLPPFFAFLKEAGFAAEIAQLEIALTSLQLHPHARLELAADFAECFLLEGKSVQCLMLPLI